VWRLRFFRILVPALLVPFVVVLFLTMRERPGSQTPSDGARPFPGARAERIELTDLLGGSRRGSITARVFQWDDQGRLHLEGIEKLVIDREEGPPLVVSAERGGVEGSPGRRLMRLEGGVSVREEEEGLAVSLPTLEVNEAAGEARSIGEVAVEDPSYKGRAAEIVYGLRGQPTVLSGLEIAGKDGSILSAQKATLLDGPRDVDLSGDVRGEGLGWRLAAGRLRIKRDKAGKLRHAVAAEDVVGTRVARDGQAGRFAADRVEASWDETGSPETILLDGNARVQRGGEALSAGRIEATRSASGGWGSRAFGAVRAAALWKDAPAVMQSESLAASLDAKGGLLRAELDGNVRFEGSGASGEAAHLTFVPGVRGEATLVSGPGRRARLARERTRVAADSLTTDPDGTELTARGRVESTLLPAAAPSGPAAQAGGLFVEGEAVHFVSGKLRSFGPENRLEFDGEVRGWQGERNLSADHVEVRQRPEELHASGNVATRIPRDRGASTSEADYIKVTAAQLDYRAADRKAVYTGKVRARQAEGWLEAAGIEILFSSEKGDVREMTASGEVRFEFHSAAGAAMPQPVTGDGDRIEYTPGESLIRLFGDEGPATVRRAGAQGGTTTGRVLRYRLDLGTIEVESGERNRARIRTPGR
jgi:lipopolysaccharide transport protein LptA